MTSKSLVRLIASSADAMIDFAARLIAIPTENPPGAAYTAFVETAAAELEHLGLASELLPIPGQAQARCLRAFHGPGRRTLYFHGHYDVVPAADPAQFRPERRGDDLFGRGSADMKAGLAAMIYAVKAIKDSSLSLQGRVGLLLVPDEETGGARGSRPLVSAGILGANGIGMLTPEPSGGTIWNASRGAFSLRVTVKGKAAHVGLHFEGVNAFEGMLDVAARLRELQLQVETHTTGYRITPDVARRSILLLGGVCSGGTNFNVVPDSVSFSIDRRINPEENFEMEKAHLLACLEEATRAGLNLETEILQEGRPAGFSEDEPLVQALARSVETVTGRVPRVELCPGLLETRYYAERSVPALAYGPGRLSVAHGSRESVSVKDVQDCATIYALTAAEILA
jgi:acetylornithine deacetylase/succinyl-diaminopimelate desuccinylase family protein